MANQSQRDDTAIDIKLLQRPFESVMADIDNLSMSPNSSIFRTPKILSRHNEGAYKPNGFSFGPFHYGNKQLEPTQNIKWKYLLGLLRRSGFPETEKYRELIEAITLLQKEARECYAGKIESCNEEQLVEILVLDGCFIIELFRKDADKGPKDTNDPISTMACLKQYLDHDLILLENQIPWLVLERLFSLTKVSQSESLIKLALDFFDTVFSYEETSVTPEQFQRNGVKIKHILDLLRHSLILPLSVETTNADNSGWEPFPCATKINEAGIKFKINESPKSILDIKFHTNGVLKIPSLLIQETTETILRNLISFEQCCPNYPPIVTSYAKLMDNLIDTDKDIEILCNTNILDNWLNPEDVKRLFNKLYNDAYVTKFYYYDINRGVNRHRKRCWPR